MQNISQNDALVSVLYQEDTLLNETGAYIHSGCALLWMSNCIFLFFFNPPRHSVVRSTSKDNLNLSQSKMEIMVYLVIHAFPVISQLYPEVSPTASVSYFLCLRHIQNLG